MPDAVPLPKKSAEVDDDDEEPLPPAQSDATRMMSKTRASYAKQQQASYYYWCVQRSQHAAPAAAALATLETAAMNACDRRPPGSRAGTRMLIGAAGWLGFHRHRSRSRRNC